MNTGLISFALLVTNLVVSYRGFNSSEFFARYEFQVEKVRVYKDYKRLVTSGFLHVGWMHLLFNMFTLYAFGSGVESFFGTAYFLVIYFASLVGGNLFSLLVYKNQGAYSSVGASGAISGLIFASIALAPTMGIGFFFLPISIPAWLYGLLFMLYSIYGIRSRKDNIGHEAHLAGGVVGMLLALALEPRALLENYLAITAILLPALLFILVIIKRPHLLLVDNFFYRSTRRHYTIDQRYNAEKRDEQLEVDRILDKIHKRGMASLTKTEKEVLDRYSRTVN